MLRFLRNIILKSKDFKALGGCRDFSPCQNMGFAHILRNISKKVAKLSLLQFQEKSMVRVWDNVDDDIWDNLWEAW